MSKVVELDIGGRETFLLTLNRSCLYNCLLSISYTLSINLI